MSVTLSALFRDRLRRMPETGEMRDGSIRYLMMRPDALMGLFARLPAEMRGPAFAALAGSVAEHGGRSVKAYRESGAADADTLMRTMVDTSADLGWGRWRFVPRPDGAGYDVTVSNSPFADGAGTSDQPVCAPIVGILTALAPLLAGEGAGVRECTCAAMTGAGTCQFRIDPAA